METRPEDTACTLLEWLRAVSPWRIGALYEDRVTDPRDKVRVIEA